MMRARYYRSIDHIHHTFTPAGDCQSLTVSGGGSCFSPSQGKNVSVCFAFLRKGNSKNHSVSYFGMIYIFWRSCIIKIKWCWNAYGTGYVPLPAKRRENVTGNIIVKPSVRQRFDSFMERGRVLFFSAPCGFGKSTLSDALLSGRDVLRLDAGAADFALPALSDGWEILLIDDFQMIPAEDGGQALCELIRSDPGKRFLLLSRGAPPGYLTAFQYSGLMTTLEADDLLFDREDICKYFSGCGVAVTDSEIGGILRESVGYPLGVAVTARCMSGGRPFGPEVVARAFREVFSYFEAAIYRRFDHPVRRFLLELAPFERFNLEMARMVSGDPHAGDRLDWLLSHTTMLRYDDVQHFRFWPQFRSFLLWEMEREYSEEKRRALFSRGALYYELKEDYAHALECYTRCGDHAKVSELLIRNAELHPGMGHYSEMEKYYRSLPEAEIAASPALMQGMSMLCALAMDYEGSERWHHELQEFGKRQGRRRRQADPQPSGVAGHLPASAGRGRADGNHSRGVPADDQQGGFPPVLLRHQCPAQRHERRQGLFRLEQTGRPALPDAPRPGGGRAGAGRRWPCGLRHRRKQI